MDAALAIERFTSILKDAAYLDGDASNRHWRAVLIPIHFGLSGFLPGDQFDRCIEHFKNEGFFAEVRMSSGESHDDDDVYYIRFSDAGVRLLSLGEASTR